MENSTDTPQGDGFDPKHKGKNVNHPRKKGSRARTGLTDQDIRVAQFYGFFKADNWRGVEVVYHNHAGGHQGAPLSDLLLPNPILGVCAIVSDPDPARPLGAAMNVYSTTVTSPTESSWVEAPNTLKAARIIWATFARLAMEKGLTWSQLYLLMEFKKMPVRIATPYEDRPTRVDIPIGRQDEQIHYGVWRRWRRDHYEFQRKEKHAYHDKEVDLACPVRFHEGQTAEESHPAVRANAIAYYSVMSAYSHLEGRLKVKDHEG